MAVKVFEDRVIPEHTNRVCVDRTCDLCGTKSKNRTGDWKAEEYYGNNDTEISIKIKYREGENYPDFGCGTQIEIDLCPKCFKERFVEWLKSEGAKIDYEEWDW